MLTLILNFKILILCNNKSINIVIVIIIVGVLVCVMVFLHVRVHINVIHSDWVHLIHRLKVTCRIETTFLIVINNLCNRGIQKRLKIIIHDYSCRNWIPTYRGLYHWFCLHFWSRRAINYM